MSMKKLSLNYVWWREGNYHFLEDLGTQSSTSNKKSWFKGFFRATIIVEHFKFCFLLHFNLELKADHLHNIVSFTRERNYQYSKRLSWEMLVSEMDCVTVASIESFHAITITTPFLNPVFDILSSFFLLFRLCGVDMRDFGRFCQFDEWNISWRTLQ